MKKNIEIREKMEKKRVKYYEVAEALGISPTYFSKLLQKELPEEQKKKVLKAIDEVNF